MKNMLARIVALFMLRVDLVELKNNARHPRKTQERLLLSIIKKNTTTSFGKNYQFAEINSYEEYKHRVPIHTYEMLAPYIEEQMAGNTFSLTATSPVMYTQTSGTAGFAKYIPALDETIESYKKAQDIFSYIQCRDVPGIFSGKILAIVSPAIEGYLSNHVPYGSMSGIVYKNMPAYVREKYILPAEIFEINDYDIKYLLIVAFSLAEKEITVLASANPSTFLRLADIIRTHTHALIEFVRTGDMSVLGITVDPSLKNKLLPYCVANHERAAQIKTIIHSGNAWTFTDLWPSLKAVVTWTSGNCALLISPLKKMLASNVVVIEMGYLCSEFRATITMDCFNNQQLPVINNVFFEFIEVNDWANKIDNIVTIENIDIGKHYYIVVTVLHGLYRYFINDIIEVTGHYKNTPTIAFLQKGKGVTNLTGEKLYEKQITEAIKQVSISLMIEPLFFIMLADQQRFGYTLYIEIANIRLPTNFPKMFDHVLSELNIEYVSKMKSGRLKPLQVKQLKEGTYEFFKSHCIRSGQREGQFKLIKLQYHQDVSFPFDEYVMI